MTNLDIKMINSQDQKLLMLLRTNARASVTELAKALHVSRSTVQNRLARLEKAGVIRGYSVILGGEYLDNQVEAHVSIKVVQKLTARTNAALEDIPQVPQLFSDEMARLGLADSGLATILAQAPAAPQRMPPPRPTPSPQGTSLSLRPR